MSAAQGSMYSYKQAIKKAERRLKESQTALGVRAYNLVKEGKISVPELMDVVGEIDSINVEIASASAAIEELKAAKEAARKTVCPFCGAVAAPGVRFCPSCGKDVTTPAAVSGGPTRTCPSCGGVIDADSTFCGICGATVSPTPPEQNPPVEKTTIVEEKLEAGPTGAIAQETVITETSTMKCPSCGGVIDADSTFCGICGAKIEGISSGGTTEEITVTEVQVAATSGKCPHCGDVLEPGAVFCVSCGKKV